VCRATFGDPDIMAALATRRIEIGFDVYAVSLDSDDAPSHNAQE
jgi:hypothetical protein